MDHGLWGSDKGGRAMNMQFPCQTPISARALAFFVDTDVWW
jgi:hypothetical protein